MNRPNQKGITFIEMIMVLAISGIAMVMVWQGVRFFQNSLTHQLRLDRTSQVLDLTQEISQAVRSAKRIVSVSPDHLELEVYDHRSYSLLDPKLYENVRRLRYQFETTGESSRLVRQVFASTAAVQPENSVVFLNNADLMTPTEAQPFFFASYLQDTSTVGVSVALSLRAPNSKELWVPIKNEVYVKAE